VDKKRQYRHFAAASLDLAKHARDEADKARLLAMAEAWLELAERTGPIAELRTRWLGDHPLVRWMMSHYSTRTE
jgi:hypothetical protein